MSLAGKIALVTGGQQGIGRAVALRLAAEGADIALNFLDDADAAEAIAGQVRDAGRRCAVVQGDVAIGDHIRRMVQEAEAHLGMVDLLVNNAGIFPRTPALEIPEHEWDAVLGVNLKGTFLCAQEIARRLVAAGRPGAMINVTSRAAYVGSRNGAHYAASKAGVIGLTRTLALELAPHRIRVNAIAPGLTDTAQPRGGMTEDDITAAGLRSPLGRIGQPGDIAAVAAFLASDDASHITGQVLHVNGGEYMG